MDACFLSVERVYSNGDVNPTTGFDGKSGRAAQVDSRASWAHNPDGGEREFADRVEVQESRLLNLVKPIIGYRDEGHHPEYLSDVLAGGDL